MNTPYTYLIGWSLHNKWYYGSRYSKECNPADLWVKYFTSSIKVSELRKTLGEPDIIQVRKTFKSVDAALLWEQRVITRMKMMKLEQWINIGNAGKEFKITEDALKKKSVMYKGTGNPNYQRTHTADARRRISEARILRGGVHFTPHSKETKDSARKRTQEQLENGSHSSQIRVCCVICQNEVTPTILTRFHKHIT